MNTQLTPSSDAVVAVKGDELEVSAATPNEMAQSQEALIAWAKNKVARSEGEAAELQSAYEIARTRKWKSDTLKRHAAMALKRVDFYKKMLAALEAGYIIVPTFPVVVFAGRTDKETPRGIYVTSYDYGYNPNLKSLEQHPKPLEQGEGEYQNPFPATRRCNVGTNDKPEYRYLSDDWKEMEFPLNMAKPNIMHATDRAMALKIFDDFGVLPNATKKVDPIIVGRIKVPSAGPYTDRIASFIIAWHLDTSTL